MITNGFFSLDILNITRLSAAAILFQLRYDNKAMKKNVILLLICCTFLLPKNLHADEVYKAFSVGRFDALLDTNYFKSCNGHIPPQRPNRQAIMMSHITLLFPSFLS